MTFFATLSRFAGFGQTVRPPLAHYLTLANQRRALRKMTPEQLSDIGVTQAEAEREAKRPIWDAPQNWRI